MGQYKRYVGSHSGSRGYNYIGSGTAFLEQYKCRPQDFRREIILHDPDIGFVQQLEIDIIRAVKAVESSAWYNLRLRVPNVRGLKQSPDHIKKRTASLKGRLFTPEWKAKISAAKRGKLQSEAHRFAGAASRVGKQRSEETKQKIRSAAQSRPAISEQTREKMRLSQQARWVNR